MDNGPEPVTLPPSPCAVAVRRRRAPLPSASTSAAYHPDLLVVCGGAADTYYETDASLIVEVRSPSTADVDRREKAVAYASLPGLGHYLLVDPYYRRIDVAVRQGDGWRWETFGPRALIRTPYGDIRLDALYDEVDSVCTTP